MIFVVDPWHYRLSLLIQGITDGYDFYIDRQVGEQLQSVLTFEDEDKGILPFFCFASTDGQRVAICVSAIEAVNYLFDSSSPVAREPGWEIEEDEELQDVILYFRNRAEPLLSTSEDTERLDEIFEELATDPFIIHKFLSFVDEDGEMLTFNAQHLVLCVIKPHEWSEESEEVT